MKKKDVLDALEILSEKYPDGASARDIKTLFPKDKAYLVYPHLTQLFQMGMITRVVNKESGNYMYRIVKKNCATKDEKVEIATPPPLDIDNFPIHHFPITKEVVKEEPNIRSRQALAIECEVCAALVGLRAQAEISLADCASCGATYLVNAGWCYRLGPAIKAQVWTPIAPTNGNS